jgi:hypothetical protein
MLKLVKPLSGSRSSVYLIGILICWPFDAEGDSRAMEAEIRPSGTKTAELVQWLIDLTDTGSVMLMTFPQKQ